MHAVTGAGKTEMMYQVVATAIKSGQAVCIATPRIDVCIELYGRMKEDFFLFDIVASRGIGPPILEHLGNRNHSPIVKVLSGL